MQISLDFSLALLNRTGAYRIGRDLMDGLEDRFHDVRYWRLTPRREPSGVSRKLLARAMLAEISARTRAVRPARAQPSLRPTLHLDPLYVLMRGVRAQDAVLCHDVGPITHAGLYPAETQKSYAIAYDCIRRAAPGVIFVSDVSRDAFIQLYGDNFRFLKTIPLYVREGVNTGLQSPVHELKRPFLLSVGAIGRRKNTARLVEAYAEAELHKNGVDLVICGARDDGYSEVRTRAATTPGVRLLSFVTDPELRWLYAHARAFCLPSLLEGFGMPALEAAARGLICVVSKDGALSEAICKEGLLVDPSSSLSIARGLRLAVGMDDDARAELACRARAVAAARTRAVFLSSWANVIERLSQ